MPAKEISSPSSEFLEAYLEDERNVRINTGRLACALVFVLMPAGVLLDLAVYPHRVMDFLMVRLLCSLIVTAVWMLHSTGFARRHYPWVGVSIPLLPALAIIWMIWEEGGPQSPYYAGLNLVLLALSAVGHWSLRESVTAVGLVTTSYVLVMSIYVRRHPPATSDFQLFFNNLYFLLLTGVIVVAGNTIFNRLRLREFSLRFELDRNRRQLQESHQKLLELDQAKSHFFANISHELRTPLTLLLAPLETILRRAEVARDASTRELLLTMQANGMRLLKLINDLLDLVRLESGRMEVRREEVDLPPFLAGLVNAVRGVAEGKQIHLETSIAPELGRAHLDRDKLEKILLNLLFNALKFTPSGGCVRLSAARHNGHLVLAVQDTGIGIPAPQLPLVFGRFWQADGSTHRKHQGAGIGLALVKELAEIQAGSVAVESEEGRGSLFTVRLPLTASPEPQETPVAQTAPTPPAREQWLENLYRRAELFPAMVSLREQNLRDTVGPGASSRQRVLVADDEPDMLRFLRSQLTREYDVSEAVDGRQAVEQATEHPPDLILLDMMMPEMDGLQACRELRRQESTRDVPIVLLTARADEETKLATLSAGANDFLSKPFSTIELEVRVRNLVHNHRLRQELARQNRLLESTIEQLKETEMQLIQAEKLASLGRLSAGIIHEINNPLHFATTNLFVLRRHGDHLNPAWRTEFDELLDDVEEGIRRVRDIVVNLRSFTHPGTGVADDLPLSGLVEAALRFLSHELRENIRLQNELPEELTAYADRNRLLQVFVNLLQNAVDAVQARVQRGEEATIRIQGRREGNRTVVGIWDNGTGIDPLIQDKIFDPFFTTKEVGEGLGLGLSISYRILQQAGGRLTFRTEFGEFTEMVIDLPNQAVPAAESPAQTVPAVPAPASV